MINDDVTGECHNCGSYCSSCNIKTGCEVCTPASLANQGYVNAQVALSSQSTVTVTQCSGKIPSYFIYYQACDNSKWCTSCNPANISQCYTCASAFNIQTSPGVYQCEVITPSSMFDNCLQGVSGNPNQCAYCADYYYLNSLNFCSSCQVSDCLECNTNSMSCSLCEVGYEAGNYVDTSSGSTYTNCYGKLVYF